VVRSKASQDAAAESVMFALSDVHWDDRRTLTATFKPDGTAERNVFEPRVPS